MTEKKEQIWKSTISLLLVTPLLSPYLSVSISHHLSASISAAKCWFYKAEKWSLLFISMQLFSLNRPDVEEMKFLQTGKRVVHASVLWMHFSYVDWLFPRWEEYPNELKETFGVSWKWMHNLCAAIKLSVLRQNNHHEPHSTPLQAEFFKGEMAKVPFSIWIGAALLFLQFSSWQMFSSCPYTGPFLQLLLKKTLHRYSSPPSSLILHPH